MTITQMIADLQAVLAQNANTDADVQFTLTAAHTAGDVIGAVTSITFIGEEIRVVPAPNTVTPPCLNILLP